MSNTSRGVRGARAITRDRVVSLKFRDRLRIQYDRYFRDAFLRISKDFSIQPTRAWYAMRRDPSTSERWWGNLLRHLDEAVLAGASEESLLEIPALMTAYIYERVAQHALPASEAAIDAEDVRIESETERQTALRVEAELRNAYTIPLRRAS